jgi:hypothetical protein
MVGRTLDWQDELERWLKPFLNRLGHKARRRILPPASPARNSKTGKKESTGPRLSQLCPPCATPFSKFSLDYRRSDARITSLGFKLLHETKDAAAAYFVSGQSPRKWGKRTSSLHNGSVHGWAHIESAFPYLKLERRHSYTIHRRHSEETVRQIADVFDDIWHKAQDAPGG